MSAIVVTCLRCRRESEVEMVSLAVCSCGSRVFAWDDKLDAPERERIAEEARRQGRLVG